MTCTTVGEAIKYLSQFPADKPLICDMDGNTWNPDFELWDNAPADDPEHPVAIMYPI